MAWESETGNKEKIITHLTLNLLKFSLCFPTGDVGQIQILYWELMTTQDCKVNRIKVILPSINRLNIFLSSFVCSHSLKLSETRDYGNFIGTIFKHTFWVVFPLTNRTDLLYNILSFSFSGNIMSHCKEWCQVPSTGLATWDKCGQLAWSSSFRIKKPILTYCLSRAGNDLKKLFLQPHPSLSHFCYGVNSITWKVEERGGGQLKKRKHQEITWQLWAKARHSQIHLNVTVNQHTQPHLTSDWHMRDGVQFTKAHGKKDLTSFHHMDSTDLGFSRLYHGLLELDSRW